MPAHRKDLHITGPNLWYLVGLITSDGCLCKDGRHIDITSKDQDFLQTIRGRLRLASKVCIKNRNTPRQAYRIQIANKEFYEFLLSIRLVPNKSLILKDIKVPAKFFSDFLRGLIDGDGCIRSWFHPSNHGEQWSLRIYSGSKHFISWLKNKVEIYFKSKGKIHQHSQSVWELKYGKMAAREIATKCYYQDCLGLERKIKLAQQCRLSYVGWKQSKTVFH